MNSLQYDAIIIGAGVAGLAALAELEAAGLRVACFEARDRIGGRIYTVDGPRPIELGAEFVHGRVPPILDIARDHGLHAVETEGRMVQVIDGELHEGDESGALLDEVKRSGNPERDETFQHFLDRTSYDDEEKRSAAGFIEGFNAARKEEVSVASVAKDMRAGDEVDGDTTLRIREGYVTIARALEGGSASVWLSSAVDGIEWKQGKCVVRLRSGETHRASRVLVTVPIGVLQARALRFDPEPREMLAAADALRFGQVARVVLRFAEMFWEEDDRFADAGFILSDQPVFPTWWTLLPERLPLLTGWSAGPKADPLLGRSKEDVTAAAVASLSRILGRDVPRVQEAWFHDWHADPWSCGAYSWVPAGGLPARETLARPVADTLYFAGEAVDLDGYGGTVHGAIVSGRRAARMMIESAVAV